MKTGSWNNRTHKCISLALIFVAISALSGCGGSPARDTSGENAPGNGTQTETVPYAPADTSLDRFYFLNGNDIYEENGTVRQIQSDCALIRSNGRWGLVDVGIGNYGNIGSQISGQLGQLAESNGGSTVLLLTHANGTTLLMMGDCEISAENNLLAGEMAGISGIDILKAGHHGNASSSGPAFMAQMQPKAVIATGIYGMYVAGEGGSLAYKCLTLGAPLYSPQFNQDGLVVAFGNGEKEYSFFNGISEEASAVQNPMEAGVISFNSIFQIEIDDTLSLVQNAS